MASNIRQLRYKAADGQRLHVHDHPSDRTCHWIDVFKPLAFVLFHCGGDDLKQKIPELSYDDEGWTRWLCEVDDEYGVMNLVKLLQQVCFNRPLPFIHWE